MRDELFLIGRILFSLVFIGSGVSGHLMQTDESTQYATHKKVPSPRNMVIVSGVAIAAAGLAIVFGIWMDLAALVIAVFLLATALMMHRFWEETDPQTKQVEMAQFMKNISLAGGALIIIAVSENAPYTITDGVF